MVARPGRADRAIPGLNLGFAPLGGGDVEGLKLGGVARVPFVLKRGVVLGERLGMGRKCLGGRAFLGADRFDEGGIGPGV